MSACASSSALPSSGPSLPTPVPKPTPPPSSAPLPPPPPVAAPTTIRGPWTFSYTPGQYIYVVSIQGTVATFPDSMATHPIPTATEQITIIIGDSVSVVDPQPVSGGCTEQRALVGRVLRVFPRIPSPLQAGTTWTDSTTVEGCSGTIPAQLNMLTRYQITGDTTINGTIALRIDRRATFSAHGEGNRGQHRVILNAIGTEIGILLVDPAAGYILGSTSLQHAMVDLTTSGRTSHFVQQTTESIIKR